MIELSRRKLIAALTGLVSLNSTCAKAAAFATTALTKEKAPLKVLASFSILADLVRTVGGAAVSVQALVGANADAHVYEPSPGDVRQIANAEVVFVNGLGFEGWLERLVSAAGHTGPIITASAGIVPRLLGNADDPHAWQSLRHARRYVATICAALSQLRPAHAANFQHRANHYSQGLQALELLVRQEFARVPKAQRRVMTSHDAFGYFGAEYDIEFVAPQGMSTDSEASAAAVARLIDQIRAQRISAIFVENIADPRLIERIANEGGAKVGGRLYSDALSVAGSEADTYMKFFTCNARRIAAGLLSNAGQGASKAQRTTPFSLFGN
jgi:zinc/manganese transport system substrate-binding protein